MLIEPFAPRMSYDLMIPPDSKYYLVFWQYYFPIGCIVTWFGVTQYVVNVINSLMTAPSWMFCLWLLKIIVFVLFLLDIS